MQSRKASEVSTAARGRSAIVGRMHKSKGLSKGKMSLLLASREQIREAWHRDERGKKGFPLNTAHLLWELEARLKGEWRTRRIRFLAYSKAPRGLRDILPEKVVRQVHEYLHEEPFQDALDELHSANAAPQARERIQNTLVTALEVQQVGEQVLPKPRGNWLHRQMLRTVRAATPEKFTDSEMAKLFDQLCPCGTKHNREAMKKF